MLKRKKVIAVIQARSGSKGIPNKNIYPLMGFPLISYSIYAAKNSKYIDELLVSTDSNEYAKISIEFGAKVPFLRNSELANDTITSVDSLKWFIEEYIKAEKLTLKDDDIIIELPAIAPFRTAVDIDLALEKLSDTNSDSVISVVNTGEKHPTRLKSIHNDLISDFTKEFPEPAKMSRRQDLTPCYIRNGAIYSMTVKTLLKDVSRSGKISRPFEMPEERSINIDNKFDLLLAKLLIENGHCLNCPGKLKRIVNKSVDKRVSTSHPKLLITTNLEMFKLEQFGGLSNYNYYYYPNPDINKTRELLKLDEWDYWIPSPCPPYIIDAALVSGCKTLKAISTPSTGSTHINLVDFESNTDIKIFTLKNNPDLHLITASSEWTFYLIMSALRKGNYIEKSMRSGYWRETEDVLRGRQLMGKTLGVIGFGRIGSNISRYASSFGMKVIAYDIQETNFPEYVVKASSIEEVAANCDVFCVCVHYNATTQNLINEKIINLLKAGSVFINTSRGEIIDELALLNRIKDKSLENVAVDVIADEVAYESSELYKMRNSLDNFQLTPHVAGSILMQ